MKRTLLFIAVILTSITTASAKVITVQVANFQFTPRRVNAIVGDVIRWVWVNGKHTTTSDQIPAGAAPWSRAINTNNRVFRYTVTRVGRYSYHCIPHQSIGMTGIIRVSTSAIAALTDFDIELSKEEKAVINWKSTNEKDIAYYSVQRSTDGVNFTEITKVNPAGSDVTTQSYRSLDNNVSDNKFIYYQLEVIDKKGNSQLSDIKMFTRPTKTVKLITSLSPNPISTAGHLMMQFNADKEGTMVVQLYNQNGGLIKQQEMTAVKGLNNGHFHLGDLNLAPGSYYIVCTLGNVQEKHAIIIK
jgi:plastocyanin